MARAVADTTRLLTDVRDVRAVVADAVQRGRCTVLQLAGELRDGPIRRSGMFRSVLAEVAEGIRSTAEGDLRDLIRTARLPMPLFNASLYDGDIFIASPDAWWPEAGVAGEVDSYEWHLSPADADRTRKRHDLMGAAGIIPLHFSPRQIRREPAEVVRMIRDALHAASSVPLSPSAPSPAQQRTVRVNECGKVIAADVPLSEMFGYATTVRSMSQGRATFTMEFAKYMEVPPNIADGIIRSNW